MMDLIPSLLVFTLVSYNFLVHVYFSTDGSAVFFCVINLIGRPSLGRIRAAPADGRQQAKRPVERGYVYVRATGRWWVGAG